MKKLLLILFLANSWITYSQTTIDIIRASNYYTKALNNYVNGNYSSALSNLKSSEENLKGKTNRDLEYLKIMANYRLKNYKTSYDLMVSYFNEEYKNKTVYYKNIKPFREKYNINYSEELTKIFVTLEEKYKVVKNNKGGNKIIDNIVSRIKATVNRSSSSFQSLVYQKLDFSKRDSYYLGGEGFYRSPKITINKNRFKKTFGGFDVYYKTSSFVGLKKLQEYKKSSLRISFKKQVSLSKYSYSFYFYESGRKPMFYNFPIYEKKNGIYTRFKNLNLFKSKNFGLKKSREIRVNFTSEETTVLEQNGILSKLRKRLKDEKMM